MRTTNLRRPGLTIGRCHFEIDQETVAFGRKKGNSSIVMTLNMYCNFKGPINTINIKVCVGRRFKAGLGSKQAYML